MYTITNILKSIYRKYLFLHAHFKNKEKVEFNIYHYIHSKFEQKFAQGSG